MNDKIYWVVSVRKFWTWTPLAVFETERAAREWKYIEEDLTGKQYKVDRVVML